MNEFVGWSLFQGKDDKCGKCGMAEKDKEGCCNDEHQHFKLKVDHQKSNVAAAISFIIAPASVRPVFDVDFHSYLNLTESISNCHAPPDLSRVRLHVLHSVFLI